MNNQSKTRSASGIRNDIAALERKLGPIEYRPLASLKRYENNPRKHPEKQLVNLTASIREFGFAMPLLVNEHDTIIAGEARLEAACRAGITEVPVIVAHHWSAAQVRAYRLADNRLAELGRWDGDSLAIELAAIIEFDESPIEVLGWETAEVDLMLEVCVDATGEGAHDPLDEQVQPPADPVSRAGDLWMLGQHRLLCGSSLEPSNWALLLDGATAAMVFTAAPYNVPVTDNDAEFAMASGNMSKPEYSTFLFKFVAAMLPHCKDGAVLDLCIDWRQIGEMLAAIESNELSLLDLCVWNKTNGGVGSLYRSNHELVFIAKKGKAPHTTHVELDRHGSYRTNVWNYAGVKKFGKNRKKDFTSHPMVKPIALVADAIRDVTHPGEIVLDAFMESGITILACERTQRRCYGMETEVGYVDVAIRSWEAMTGEQAVLAGTDQTFGAVALERAVNSIAGPAHQSPPAANLAA